MTAAAHPLHAPIPIAEMRRLYDAGYSLIPLGGGDDGKSPLVRFQGSRRLPFSTVVDRMRRAGSAIYGIRLPDLLVVDVDTDTPEARAYVAERFPLTPFTVATSRGLHLWYRFSIGTAPKSVRLSGVAIDFKSGAGSYVAGPGSVRPDGHAYHANGELIGPMSKLPVFADFAPQTSVPLEPRCRIPKGERTAALWARAREYVECVDTEEELASELLAYRDWNFEDVPSFTNREVIKAAEWAWRKRLENNLWGKDRSVVKTYVDELQALLQHRNGPDAHVLLTVLRHAHSGRDRSGKPFMVAARKMADAETIPGWKADRYYRALSTLQTVGLVRCLGKADGRGEGGYRANLYAFGRLMQEAEQGGRVSNYIGRKYATGEIVT